MYIVWVLINVHTAMYPLPQFGYRTFSIIYIVSCVPRSYPFFVYNTDSMVN